MNVQSIELMGPEYILMLGVWWGVAVFLTLIFLTARRARASWRQRREDLRTTASVARTRLDA